MIKESMKFVVLGSGSSSPHFKRSSSAYWVETSEGTILLDCSASAIHRMAQEKLDWANLDAIWISHFHLDHFGGLMPFLFGTKYAFETQSRTKPLKIFGGCGLTKLLEILDKSNEYNVLEQPFPVQIVEIEEFEPFSPISGIEAVAFSTPHTPESHAIRLFDVNRKSIVFTSDTGFTKSISGFAKNTDLLVMECSFFQNKPTEKHLEFAEVMYLAKLINPKRLLLTHFYSEWDSLDLTVEVKEYSPKFEVIEATDGLIIEI